MAHKIHVHMDDATKARLDFLCRVSGEAAREIIKVSVGELFNRTMKIVNEQVAAKAAAEAPKEETPSEHAEG